MTKKPWGPKGLFFRRRTTNSARSPWAPQDSDMICLQRHKTRLTVSSCTQVEDTTKMCIQYARCISSHKYDCLVKNLFQDSIKQQWQNGSMVKTGAGCSNVSSAQQKSNLVFTMTVKNQDRTNRFLPRCFRDILSCSVALASWHGWGFGL